MINANLRRGDVTTVAEIVGCHPDLIRRMLKFPEGHPFHRNPDSKTGKEIINAFEVILKTRKSLRQAHEQKLKQSA